MEEFGEWSEAINKMGNLCQILAQYSWTKTTQKFVFSIFYVCEEWHVIAKSQVDNVCKGAKCWECGKKFGDLTALMTHYQSHDIAATCHICQITFRRLTSLSMHLDNAHSPPLCRKCGQSFNNMWELNKHTETHCKSSLFQKAPASISAIMNQNNEDFPIDMSTRQRTNSMLPDSVSVLRPQQRPETSENSVEYIVGEDDKDNHMESDCERIDDSSSESDDEDKKRSKPADDPESDGGSSSTDCSSDSSNGPPVESPMCSACGRGPFRSMKLHLLHCSGIRVKYQCSVCNNAFLTELSLKEHYMPLYSCEACGQVFPRENSERHHQCPKGTKSQLVLFCSESMPQACNVCKSFFGCKKTLLNHVSRVHTSVVSTKVCIITNPSALTDKKVSPGGRGAAAISSPHVVNQVMNGKLHVGQTYAGSLSSPSSLSTSSHRERPPATTSRASSAALVRSEKHVPPGPANQLLGRLSAPSPPPGVTDTTPTTAAPKPVTPPSPTILAMFDNESHDVALMKRMNTGWRSKAPYPCKQCGAVSRQPSLIISHRYLHRGPRSHQCQCGRAFKHRLHLLRHCVQHAEAVSYICVSCGETFTGAKLLAEHLKGKSGKKSSSGRTRKRKVKRKCKMPFTCDCGQLFFRPSAYIWHQLKNRTKTKQSKKPLEGQSKNTSAVSVDCMQTSPTLSNTL